MAVRAAKIRDKYTCRYCGKKYTEDDAALLDGHHVFPKGSSKEVTWYMLDNICPLCRLPCHDWAGKNEHEFKDWWRDQIGDVAFSQIEHYSKQAEKMTLQNYDDLITLYRSSI